MADELEEGEVLETDPPADEGEQETGSEAAPATETPGAEPVAAEEPKKEPWFTKRIGVLTAEKQAERQAREQLQKENEALKALIGKPQGDPPPADAPSPSAAPQDDFQKAVASAAAAQVALQRFNEQCDAVAQKGATLFPGKFDQAVANLNAAGVIRRDDSTFLEAALATESPEQVIFKLGNEPEEAMRLASLPPTQLAVALDRMARDLTKAPEKTSDAPAPLTQVNGTRTTKPFDPADPSVPSSTWMREREKQVQARKNAL